MYFVKMHGLLNDYVIIDCMRQVVCLNRSLFAKIFSNRKEGIGGDGVIFIDPPKNKDAACFMEMYNADGSFSPICGNGLRMVAQYAFLNKYTRKSNFFIETNSGLYEATVCDYKKGEAKIRVCIGKTKNGSKDCLLEIDNKNEIHIPLPENLLCIKELNKYMKIKDNCLLASFIHVGNPHCVVFTDINIPEDVFNRLGAYLETAPCFPNRTNVEVCFVKNKKEISIMVWERGTGPTMACGTGACAVFEAARVKKLCANYVYIQSFGGRLLVEKEDDDIYLTGKTRLVYEGCIDINE